VSLPGDATNTTELAPSRVDTLFVEAEGGSPSEFRLYTHFQRFSVSPSPPVGYEGLIRGTDSNGKAICDGTPCKGACGRAAHAARSPVQGSARCATFGGWAMRTAGSS